MNLEQFAVLAGVEILECDKKWGGTVAYKEKNYPNCVVAGFKTKESAFKHWIKSTFGEQTSKAVIKLISHSGKGGK